MHVQPSDGTGMRRNAYPLIPLTGGSYTVKGLTVVTDTVDLSREQSAVQMHLNKESLCRS